jgi:hypothetical protein
MAVPLFAQKRWFPQLGFATAEREWRHDRTLEEARYPIEFLKYIKEFF